MGAGASVEAAAAVNRASVEEVAVALKTLSEGDFEYVVAAVDAAPVIGGAPAGERAAPQKGFAEDPGAPLSSTGDSWVVLGSSVGGGARPQAAARCTAWPSEPSLTTEIAYELPAATLDASVVRTVLSVVAPAVDGTRRAPLQLVVVLDRSRSMQKQGKWQLLLQTTLFILRHLSARDKIGIVVFDEFARVLAPLTRCDDAGRAALEAATAGVDVGRDTNLSGGLLRGIELHKEGASADEAGVVRTTLLFTDGEANAGILHPLRILEATRAMLEELGPLRCTVSTFGFGAGHSANLLQAIAEAGAGSYCFVENEECIGESFGGMLGGLLTMTHQNVRMSIVLRAGIQVHRLWTLFPWSLGPNMEAGARRLEVEIGDLYAEERRDILVSLKLPEAASAGAYELGTFDVQGFSVLTLKSETSTRMPVSIERGGGGQGSAAPNPLALRQQNRHITALALAAAQRVGNAGNLEGARCGIIAAAGVVSDSALTKTGDVFSLSLVRDLNECLEGMWCKQAFRQKASKQIASMASAHASQRACGQVLSETYATAATTTFRDSFKRTVVHRTA